MPIRNPDLLDLATSLRNSATAFCKCVERSWQEKKLQSQDQPATGRAQSVVDARREPRFRIYAEIRVNSRTCGLQTGQTVDISLSGISAMLKIEVPLGEVVELDFILPFGAVTTYAMVRQRSAFRYGFQFVESITAHHIIRATCRYLAGAKSTRGGA
jgi:hypothetical protein